MEAVTFAGVLGAIVGSFLNVVAYRLPRHESLIAPASHCTVVRYAGQALRQHPDPLVPAAARPLPQLLGARSRRAIRWSRRPTAALCAGRGACPQLRRGVALSLTLILIVVPAALIDLEHRIIPNR